MTVTPLNRDFIAGFQRGTYEAVRELYHLYYSDLFEFAEQLTLDKAVAHDIVLDAYVKLFRMRMEFDSMSNIKAFLYLTVRNICQSYLDADKKPASGGSVAWYSNEAEHVDRFNDDAVRAKAIVQLCKAVEELPEKCRLVFQSLFCRRLPVPEVVAQLNMDAATVMQQRRKAIQQLREHLHHNNLFSVPLYIYFLAVACAENC